MSHPRARQSFNRAATTYAASATLQKQVADQLLQAVGERLPPDFAGRVLDAGCGTGYCLDHLVQRFPAASLIGLDFAGAMLHQIGGDRLRIHGDLEALPLAEASLDLYLSSLAWQWCDVSTALNEAARVLKPGAALWVATLVSGTFAELGAVLSEAGLNPAAHLLGLSTAATVRAAFADAPFQLLKADAATLTTWHADFAALRRSIRGVGANQIHQASTPSEPLNRVARQRLTSAYETRCTAQGLPLTYQVLILHARRLAS